MSTLHNTKKEMLIVNMHFCLHHYCSSAVGLLSIISGSWTEFNQYIDWMKQILVHLTFHSVCHNRYISVGQRVLFNGIFLGLYTIFPPGLIYVFSLTKQSHLVAQDSFIVHCSMTDTELVIQESYPGAPWSYYLTFRWRPLCACMCMCVVCVCVHVWCVLSNPVKAYTFSCEDLVCL